MVGHRAEGLRAAARLGLAVTLVAEKPPGRAIAPAEYVACDLSAGPDHWQGIAARLGSETRYSAVLASTERAVVPAAHLRSLLDLPGAEGEAALRWTDKALMKSAVRGAGIETASFVTGDEVSSTAELVERLGFPMVAKPRRGQGGRGRQIWRTTSDLLETLPTGMIVESFVCGTEMSIESLVHRGGVVFSNLTEYLEPGWASIVPATLPPELVRELDGWNRRVLRALGLTDGIAHLELFRGSAGPIFGELAARPPGGYLMELIRLAYDFEPWDAWIALALERPARIQVRPRRHAGAVLLHPGPGRVRRVAGVEAARAVPGVHRVRVRVRPQDAIAARLGVGQEVGHVIVVGRHREEVADRLGQARRHIEIELERP